MNWTELPPMTTRRYECQAGLVTYPDGASGVLVAGGHSEETSEFLNLQTLTWEPKARLPMSMVFMYSTVRVLNRV